MKNYLSCLLKQIHAFNLYFNKKSLSTRIFFWLIILIVLTYIDLIVNCYIPITLRIVDFSMTILLLVSLREIN